MTMRTRQCSMNRKCYSPRTFSILKYFIEIYLLILLIYCDVSRNICYYDGVSNSIGSTNCCNPIWISSMFESISNKSKTAFTFAAKIRDMRFIDILRCFHGIVFKHFIVIPSNDLSIMVQMKSVNSCQKMRR